LLDEVLNLEHLGLARELDTDVRQDRHEAVTERLELLSRGPNLTDFHVVLVSESNMHFETCGIRPQPGLFEPPHTFVVLRSVDVRGIEPHNDAHSVLHVEYG